MPNPDLKQILEISINCSFLSLNSYFFWFITLFYLDDFVVVVVAAVYLLL